MRRLAVVLAACAAGCGVPARDNPRDPSIAPSVRLLVVDATVEGACGSVEPAEGWPIAASASRGSCIALDASDHSDPQGDSLRYSYFVVTTSGLDSLETDGGELYPIPEPLRRGLVPDRAVTFLVRAIDPGGAFGESEATVLLTNAPPIADAGPLRILPVGGHPDAPEAPFVVALDGAGSIDPDGDVLQYCWSALDALPGTCAATTPAYTPSPISATVERRHVVWLTVSDGFSTSAPSPAILSVQVPDVWATVGGRTTMRRLDSSYRELDSGLASPVHAMAMVPGVPAGVLVASETGIALLDTSGAIRESDPASGAALALQPLAATAGVTRVWSLRDDAGTALAEALDVESAGLSGQRIELVAPGLDLGAIPAGETWGLADASDGHAWIAVALGVTAHVLDTDSLAGTVDAAIGTRFTGLGARPGTDEVWLAEGRDPSATAGAAAFALARVTAGAPVIFARRQTGLFDPVGLAWVDGSRFWTYSAGDGVFLVDADALVAGADFDDAILARHPEVPEASILLADSATGDCIAGTSSSGTTRIRLDGRVDFALQPGLRILAIDESGALWSGAGANVRRSRAIEPHRGAEEIHRTSRAAARDRRAGGLWMVVANPDSLVRFSADGRLEETLPLSALGDPVPLTQQLAISRDASEAWILTAGANPFSDPFDLAYASLSTGAITLTSVTLPEPMYVYSYGEVHAATGFAWVRTGDRVVAVPAGGGAPTTDVVLPVGFEYRTALSDDDSLCVFYLDGSDQVRLERLEDGGALTPVGVAPAADDPVDEIAVAASPGRCWAVLSTLALPEFEETWTVFGWTGPGAPDRFAQGTTAGQNDRAFSLAAPDDDVVVFPRSDGVVGFGVQVRFDPSGVPTAIHYGTGGATEVVR